MRIYREVDADSFEFWSGGQDTVDDLTIEELEQVWEYLEDLYRGESPDEYEINDFFWHERDEVARVLGYPDYDELLKDR